MKNAAIIFNILSSAFTFFVLITDGHSEKAAYIVFTVLLLLVPVLSLLVISSIGNLLNLHLSSSNRVIRIITIFGNIILFGFTCWALADQYPHPKENGFITYAVLTLLTPIFNLVVLLFIERKPAAIQGNLLDLF